MNLNNEITDEGRKQAWRQLGYGREKDEHIPDAKFDRVLKQRIGTLKGMTVAKAVAMTGFTDTPPEETRDVAEMMITAKVAMHKWVSLIQAMKSALPDTKLSKKRQMIFLVDVVVELLHKEMCMFIFHEEPLHSPVINIIERFVEKTTSG